MLVVQIGISLIIGLVLIRLTTRTLRFGERRGLFVDHWKTRCSTGFSTPKQALDGAYSAFAARKNEH
jgi:hypothetical protein